MLTMSEFLEHAELHDTPGEGQKLIWQWNDMTYALFIPEQFLGFLEANERDLLWVSRVALYPDGRQNGGAEIDDEGDFHKV